MEYTRDMMVSLSQLHENAFNAGLDDVIVHDLIDDIPDFGIAQLVSLQVLESHDGEIATFDRLRKRPISRPVRASRHSIPVLDAKDINQLIQFTTGAVAVDALSRAVDLICEHSRQVFLDSIDGLQDNLAKYNWMLVDDLMLNELQKTSEYKESPSVEYHGGVRHVGSFKHLKVYLYTQASHDPAWERQNMALVGYNGPMANDSFLVWALHQPAIVRSENPHRVDVQDEIDVTPGSEFVQYVIE